MDSQTSFPYVFNADACKTCRGHCCRGSAGYVWISTKEVEKLAGTKRMDVASFVKAYLRQVQGRLSLQERKINGEHCCCFFDPIEGWCTIYQNRPEQCRTFPFWDRFMTDAEPLLLECPGVSLKKPGREPEGRRKTICQKDNITSEEPEM